MQNNITLKSYSAKDSIQLSKSGSNFAVNYYSGSIYPTQILRLSTTGLFIPTSITASLGFRGNLTGTASYASNALSSSLATTASFVNTLNQNLTLIGNQTITGSLTVTNNLIVLGSSSLQYMSQSTLNIGTNLITVNTFNPSVRFGGLAVIDSGSSPQSSGSFLYDSVHDEFIFVHRGDGTNVTSSHFLVGPQTYNDLGNETYIAANTLLKSQGNEHIVASTITDTSTLVAINNNTSITGAFTVLSGSAVELQVTGTGVRLGNVITDAHTATGSFNISGSFNVLGTSIFNRNSVGDVAQFAGGVRSLYIYSSNNNANIGDAANGAGELISFSAGNNLIGFNTNGNNRLTLSNALLNSTVGVTITGSLSVTGSATFDGNVFITGSGTNSLTVRGTGATSATNALAIQNSLGSSSLVVRNDGALVIGRGLATISSPADGTLTLAAQAANAYRVQITANEYVYITSPLGIVMPSGQNFLGYGAFKFSAIGGGQNVTTGTFNQQLFNDSFAPTTGTGIYNALNISNTINQNVAATGVSRGILISPTLTRAQDYRAIETTNGRVIFAGSGSALPIFTVQGSQGELFSVTDSLSGSLFSVNDISGLPILEVFSDNTILMGDYQDPMLLTTKKITQTVSGPFAVYSIPTASYDGAFIDYTIKSGSNARAGTIMSTWANSLIEFTEVDTMDIGSTTAVNLSMVLSGANAILTGSSSTGAWTIRTIIRTI